MALLVLVVVAGLAALFLIPGSTPRIDTRRYPTSLAVLEQVPVNDSRQWILIRSESTTNPVVLFVHGGPGTSWLTLLSAKYFEALKAPRKQLVWFERSAPLPNTEEKDKFNEFMIHTVLPTLPEWTGT
jgi:hypothetical protein